MLNSTEEKRLMRLYNVYYICKNAREVIADLKAIRFDRNSRIGYRLENWGQVYEALEALYTVSCMKENIEKAFRVIPLINRTNEVIEIASEEYSELQKHITSLMQRLDAIIKLYESMDLEETKIGLEVKIPQSDSLSDYIDILRNFDFILEQCPYCRIEGEQLKFSGTDVGSSWLTFALISEGTYRILNNIGKLIDKAIGIKSHLVTLKMQQEELESMKLKNEIGQETMEIFQKMKKLTYKKYVDELSVEIAPPSNGEEESKVEKSLEKLADLIDKGVEIYTSIETPKEVKAVFPVSNKQELLPEGLIKYLDDKSNA